MSKSRLHNAVLWVAYSVIVALAISAFYIFKPFVYVDNAPSRIICNNGAEYEAGWNFIYSLDGKLDDFNDAKARKLCMHGAIKDYGNTLSVPLEKNYRFEPQYITESSWADAIIMFLGVIFFGIVIAESVSIIFLKKNSEVFDQKKLLVFGVAILIIGFLGFIIFLKVPVEKLHCQRQVARKINNFKRIIFKYGIFPIPEEQKHLDKAAFEIYNKCLTKN